VALLRRIMAPYPLPTPCVTAAMAALDDEAQMRQRVATTDAERARVAAALAVLPGVREVLPSRANFLTLRLADAGNTYRTLAGEGIVVRDVGRYPGLTGCLRFSIGTPAQNDRLLQAMTRIGESA
jgi:histidinol-phosphate aminotransferase